VWTYVLSRTAPGSSPGLRVARVSASRETPPRIPARVLCATGSAHQEEASTHCPDYVSITRVYVYIGVETLRIVPHVQVLLMGDASGLLKARAVDLV
jgi:hypothetical protein